MVLFMKESSEIIREVAMESWSLEANIFILENSVKERKKEKAFKNLTMVVPDKDFGRVIAHMGFHIHTLKKYLFMRVNLKKENTVVKEP